MRLIRIQSVMLLLWVVSAHAASCTWTLAPASAPAVPNPGTDYYMYNAPIQAGQAYVLTAPALPTVSYFTIEVYANGVPLGGLADYQLRIAAGQNFFPAPGSLASAPMGGGSVYTISIGGPQISPNYIALPPSVVGQQIEIFLRLYPPLGNVVLPSLSLVDAQNGQPVSCPTSSIAYFTGSTGISVPITSDASDAQVEFIKTVGSGLYPDTNGYLVAAVPTGGMTFLAFPKPTFPACVGLGCVLDRRNQPAYSSFQVAGLTTTQSYDGLSDRDMTADSDGNVYLAAAPLALAPALQALGYRVLSQPVLQDPVFVYRQKLPPAGYANSIAKVPVYPAASPQAPLYIAASPVGVFCPITLLGARSACVQGAKARLKALISCYASARQGGAGNCQ